MTPTGPRAGIERKNVETIDILLAELAKPVVRGKDRRGDYSDHFDPWEVFPSLYGSYSSDFDDMAILVLDNILNKRWGRDHGEGLAHEMFREMLCTAGLCDYGTSPRGCFPDWSVDGIEELLASMLAKWREYRDAEWAENAGG